MLVEIKDEYFGVDILSEHLVYFMYDKIPKNKDSKNFFKLNSYDLRKHYFSHDPFHNMYITPGP